MKITNKAGLPEAFVRAVKAFEDEYDSEGAYLTASSISDPPRQRMLKNKHRDELTEDATERVWAVAGQAMHKVLEMSARPEDIVERRFGYNFAYTDPPSLVSAKIDLYEPDTCRLTDWKSTSAWTLVYKDRLADWTAQLNVGARLMKLVGEYEVREVQVVAYLRDWSAYDAAKSADYPQQPVVVVPLELWPIEVTERFICDRLQLNKSADRGSFLPQCTPEERWQKADVYAVMKPGRKSSLKNCDTVNEANSVASTTPGAYVVKRPGSSVRCQKYCVVGRDTGFCGQWESERNGASEVANG